jgi:hypothetical protein
MSDRTYYGEDTDIRPQIEQTVSQAFPLLFVALAIGIVLAVLFASDAGEKARHQFSETVEDRFVPGHNPNRLQHAFNHIERQINDLRQMVEHH